MVLPADPVTATSLHDYERPLGANVAKCFVEDRILEHNQEFTVFDKPHLWRMIPKGVMYKYVNPLYKKQLRLLVKEGKDCHSLIYDKDGGLKRKLRQFKGQMGQAELFRLNTHGYSENDIING